MLVTFALAMFVMFVLFAMVMVVAVIMVFIANTNAGLRGFGNYLADNGATCTADTCADDSTSATTHFLANRSARGTACRSTNDGTCLPFALRRHGTADTATHGTTNNSTSLATHRLANRSPGGRADTAANSRAGIAIRRKRMGTQ